MAQYFKREIENELLRWKNDSDLVLTVDGARHVGKTTVLKHFAEQNFRNVIHISFTEDSGRLFLECIDKYKGSSKSETFYMDILTEYSKCITADFTNDENTLVLISEIQNNWEVYNMIKPMHDYLNCRVAVTSSYFCRIIEARQPMWRTYSVDMYPLSFLEFAAIFDKKEGLEKLYRNRDFGHSEEYKRLYELYCSVGGYPTVVQTFIDTHNPIKILEAQKAIVDSIIEETAEYYKSAAYCYQLSSAVNAIVKFEAEGRLDGRYVDGLYASSTKNFKNFNVSRETLEKHVRLLEQIGIISSFGKHKFLRDMGILSYFLETAAINTEDKESLLAENFIYKILEEPYAQYQAEELNLIFGHTPEGDVDLKVFKSIIDQNEDGKLKPGAIWLASLHVYAEWDKKKPIPIVKGMSEI